MEMWEMLMLKYPAASWPCAAPLFAAPPASGELSLPVIGGWRLGNGDVQIGSQHSPN